MRRKMFDRMSILSAILLLVVPGIVGCLQPEKLIDRKARVVMDAMSDVNQCTLVVLRHCEKGSGSDPSLTDEGFVRSEALAQLLGDSPITRILCTEYRRTHQSVEALSRSVGVEIETISAADSPAWREVLAQISAGDRVVICGHQNTVPLFVEAVGGTIGGTEKVSGQAWIPGYAFDRLYLITWNGSEAIPASSASTVELRYGTVCDPS